MKILLRNASFYTFRIMGAMFIALKQGLGAIILRAKLVFRERLLDLDRYYHHLQ